MSPEEILSEVHALQDKLHNLVDDLVMVGGWPDLIGMLDATITSLNVAETVIQHETKKVDVIGLSSTEMRELSIRLHETQEKLDDIKETLDRKTETKISAAQVGLARAQGLVSKLKEEK